MTARLITGVAVAGAVALAAALAAALRRAAKTERTLESVTRQLEQLQQAFHRFAPQEVVEEIIRKGVTTRGERREVTVLFADLVGFTSMSERTDPETVVAILNGYFESVCGVIDANGGYVSKFMGDGLLALFGAPEPNPWQCRDAVEAALAMRTAVAEYNHRLAAEGRSPLGLSVGLHHGTVVAGVVGSSALVEYTVIGDVVNTAARIESLTRVHGVDILVSGSVRERLDERFVLREMPRATVKGKLEPVASWALVGLADLTSADTRRRTES